MPLRPFVVLIALVSLSVPLFAAEIKTIAGNGTKDFGGDGGEALKAGVVEPFGLDIGPDGALYWAEFGSHIVRRMDLQSKTVSTYAGMGGKPGYKDGPALTAQFNQPHEVRFDTSGNLFISDMTTQTIRKIDWKTKAVSTVAGNGKKGFSGDGGPATQAELSQPISVVLDREGGFLLCDIGNHRVRGVDSQGVIHTVAGTGDKKPTPDASPVVGTPLNGPRTLAVESNGNVIIVLREGNAVYRWNRQTNTLHHVAGVGQTGYTGDGGDAKQAKLNGPKGVAIGPDGDIYLADTENSAVRVIHLKNGVIETVVGDGQKGDGPEGDPKKCRLNRPHGVFFDAAGSLFIGDSENHKVRKVTW